MNHYQTHESTKVGADPTVGNEACVVIDWQGVADYAKR